MKRLMEPGKNRILKPCNSMRRSKAGKNFGVMAEPSEGLGDKEEPYVVSVASVRLANRMVPDIKTSGYRTR